MDISLLNLPHKPRASSRARALLAAILALTLIYSGAASASAASHPPRSELQGSLTLASAQWAGSDLMISFREGISFTIPGDAGYMVYERNDKSGVRHLCVSSHNGLGLAFELVIDVFQLDTADMTPIEVMGRSILSAGRRAVVVHSGSIDMAGLCGFDITLRGVPYDRQVPQTDMRSVFLSNLRTGIMFTLVERQHLPDEHGKALSAILATLRLSTVEGVNV